MLGISVYFKTFDPDYVKQATKNGIKFIFTSLHIPEEDFTDITGRVEELLALCKQEGVMLVPDVSPVTFEKLNLKSGDFEALKKMGFRALRLDWGFNDFDLLSRLQKDFTLFLNASVLSKEYLNDAKAHGVDFAKVHASHNFYPKLETGLSKDRFNAINQNYIGTPVHVLAFVPGDQLKRFPFYQGLPTLETQRGQNPYVSAVELINEFGVTDIAIGDSEARLTTLENIHLYQQDKTMTLPIIPEPEGRALLGRVLDVRKDIPERMIRVSVERKSDIPIGKTGDRPLGTISQDNLLAGRYSGEIQISKSDLPFTRDANIIGYVHPEYTGLLKFIDGETKLCFVEG
ncbi:MupG family TIM beta-alpha barrel fold protein [Lacticaseibacillus hegangensis]|uniref:MupG family TIM beta-alpha barrel fold protein n=1 Tax=Lacticaseibacillus hegangensis TaxID=2486010 RepID=A0ABW4CYA9_9LACO|nr:MupG family TIM beta-alpha barrel fold protein [Lacticaseibacillus hegangensis]